MTTGTLLEVEGEVNTSSHLFWLSKEKTHHEERVGSFPATSQTPSELKLEHLQESQVAEGASRPQSPEFVTALSAQVQVASDVQAVQRRVQPPVVPPIRLEPEDIAPEARPYLNGDMEKLARVLLLLIEVESARSWMPVQKVEVGLKRSYEEDWIEVVFRVYVKANAAQALAFWHAIGSAIDRWRPSLSARAQRFLDEQIAVFVEW